MIDIVCVVCIVVMLVAMSKIHPDELGYRTAAAFNAACVAVLALCMAVIYFTSLP